jgi:hypothetical protein
VVLPKAIQAEYHPENERGSEQLHVMLRAGSGRSCRGILLLSDDVVLVC